MRIFNTVWSICLLVTFSFFIASFFVFEQPGRSVRAQVFGVNFLWADSTTALTTVAVDCAYTTQWEQVLFKADTGAVWIRFGAPDTTSWSSREWYLLGAGEALSFGPATPLARAEYKAFAGTVDFYTLGYKKTAQF